MSDILELLQLPCPSFWGESFTHNGKINFAVPSLFRTFKIIVDKKCFYVSPDIVSRVSPVFGQLCAQTNFVEGRMGECVLAEEDPADIHCFIQCICPYDEKLQPKPIDETNLAILLRLADKFLVDGLRRACEDFIRTCDFSCVPHLSLLPIFVEMRKQQMDLKVLMRLAHLSSDDLDNDKFFEKCEVERAILRNLAYQKEWMKHRILKHIEVQGLKCSDCQNITSAMGPQTFYCSECTLEMCRKCTGNPCPKLLTRFLTALRTREDFAYKHRATV